MTEARNRAFNERRTKVSVETRPMFYLQCDLCGGVPNAMDGIVAWSDQEGAEIVAQESEWTLKDGKHYCPEHFICEDPGCHRNAGPLAGEQDYYCDEHAEAS